MESDELRRHLHSPVNPILPPRFMYTDEEGRPQSEKEIAVITDHYNELVDLLDGGERYDTLLSLKQRLGSRKEKAQEDADRYESRFRFCKSQEDGIKARIRHIAEFECDEGRDLDCVIDQVLERSMGEHWGTDGAAPWNVPRTGEKSTVQLLGTDGGTLGNGPRTDKAHTGDQVHQEGWSLFEERSVDLEFGDSTLPKKSDLRITYTPESGRWDREYEDEHIERYDRLIFRGDETWAEAVDLAERRRDLRGREYEERRRTARFLYFRFTVAQTVLYQFEAFGSVEPMSNTEAHKHARQELPDIFEGRPTLQKHAEKIVEKYSAEPKSLPETMSDLKAWIGRDGENAVTQLQSAIREADLSHRYKDGHPESFCDLVEDLLHRYYRT